MENLASNKHCRRVLFVDDEEMILKASRRALKETDVEVSTATSAEEGLLMVDEQPFDVIVSDYCMNGMNGIKFFEEIKRRFPDTVRILISGQGDYSTAIEVINRVGLFKLILKPWDPADLSSTVSRAMEHYELALENRALNAQLAEKVDQLGNLNASLEAEVQSRTECLLFGLANALDLRDTETQSHSWRVALYASRLAVQLGLHGNEVLDIERGSLLHDIGKIGVSDTILLKPGKLTDEEWVEMRRHSYYGYRMIKHIDFLENASKLVWEHHERWDGRGYPRGRRGDDICIGAKIFAVVDTYDAITSDRPYRKAQTHEVAIEEIEKMSGTQFDPSIVNAWLAIPKQEIISLKERAEMFTFGDGGADWRAA